MKKRIVTIALVIALLATCFAGTYAYLKDSHAIVNSFTTGNVYITLDEQKIGSDTERTAEDQEYKLLPGMTVTKDPTITVKDDSENAWVAAKITVTAKSVSGKSLYDLIGIPGTDMIDINAVAKGGLLEKTPSAVENWNNLPLVHETDDCYIYQVADKANNTWTLYIFMKAQQQENAKVVLFKTLTALPVWDNAEMAVIDTLEIKVEAFAAQAQGFADCFAAMKAAFPTAFNF